jgi:hypothetical protein
MSDLYERRNGPADRIDRFSAGPATRGDQWRTLVELAEAWSNGSGNRTEFEAALIDITATEEFHAFPRPQLMTPLGDHAGSNDAHVSATLARRITRALLTRSFRQHASDWDAHENGEGATSEMLPPTLAAAMGIDLISRSSSSLVRPPSAGPRSSQNSAACAGRWTRSCMNRSSSAVSRMRSAHPYSTRTLQLSSSTKGSRSTHVMRRRSWGRLSKLRKSARAREHWPCTWRGHSTECGRSLISTCFPTARSKSWGVVPMQRLCAACCISRS